MSFYDDASWLLIPSGIKEDVVYAQKPISGLGDLTFTRASDATYTDASGVVRRSPYNLFQQSEMFSNAIWTKNGGTIGIDAAVAPNGTMTADKLIPNNGQSPTGGTSELLSQSGTLRAAVYTFSIYAKAAEFTSIRFRETQFSGQLLNVDLTNGSITGGGSQFISPSAISVGNGWYRISFTSNSFTLMTSASQYAIRCASTGDGTSGIFIWGAQLVEGNEALPYFPTTNRQDVPRIDFRNADGTLSSCGRLLLEPQRTNSIRNSSMVGAVAGSPGTLPTNWTQFFGTGLTRTVVGTGTENGLPYVDVRFNGTVTTISTEISTETSSAISVSNGQVWSNSGFIKIISAPLPPNSYSLKSYYWNGGSYVSESTTPFTPTTTLARYSAAHTVPAGTITHISQSFRMNLTNGAAYDFTIRIAAPQMELGAYATTWVPTTTAAVTRLADTASKTGVSSLIGQTEGTLFFEFTGPSQSNVYYSLSAFGLSNTILVGVNPSGQINARIFAPFPTTPINIGAFPYTAGQRYKVAFAYNSTQCAIAVNGVLQTTSGFAGFSAGTLVRFGIDNSSAGSQVLLGTHDQAVLFPTRLTNAQLAQLTTL